MYEIIRNFAVNGGKILLLAEEVRQGSRTVEEFRRERLHKKESMPDLFMFA